MTRLIGILALIAGIVGSIPLTVWAQQPPAEGDTPLPPGALVRLGNGQSRSWIVVYSSQFSPDGKSLIAGGSEKVLRQWDPVSGKLLRQFGEPRQLIQSVCWSPDGKIIAAGALDDIITLWDAETGKLLKQIQNAVGNGSSAKCLAFSPDGLLLAVAGDRKVRLRDAVTGSEVRSLVGHQGMVDALAFSADGKVIATCSSDRTFRLWEVATGKPLHQIAEFQTQANSLAFSPDSKILATGGADAGIRLWDVAKGELLRQISGHVGPIRALCFSPDGRTLASGGSDQVVHLWEVSTGKERRQFTGPKGALFTLNFSPNGQLLASGGQADPTMLIWDVTGLRSEGRRPADRLRPAEAEALWTELASDDAAKAYHAVWALALSPAQAVPLLAERLKPVAPADTKYLARLVANLDSDRFPIREKAMRELESLGEAAVPELKRLLQTQPSVEVQKRLDVLLERFAGWVTSSERVRGIRGVEVLEQIDTAEARLALEKLSKLPTEADLSQEAQAALKRLDRPAAMK